MKKRVHVFYSGSVQGVGFRFTAEAVANELGVNGIVRNLSDGRVEVIAEGEKASLDEFLDRIKSGMGRYISGAAAQWQEPTGEFKEFAIAF